MKRFKVLRKRNPLITDKSELLNYFFNKNFKVTSKLGTGINNEEKIILDSENIQVVLYFENNKLIRTRNSSLWIRVPNYIFQKEKHKSQNYLIRNYFIGRYDLYNSSNNLIKKHLFNLTSYYNFMIDVLSDIQQIPVGDWRGSRILKNPFRTLNYKDAIKYFKNIGFIFPSAISRLLINIGQARGVTKEGKFEIVLQWNENTQNINLADSTIILLYDKQDMAHEYSLNENTSKLRKNFEVLKNIYLEAIQIISDIT